MHAYATASALLLALTPQHIDGRRDNVPDGPPITLAQSNAPPNTITSGWPPGTFVNDSLHAYEAAAKQKKPLTIFFGAYWCKLCFAMRDGVLSCAEFAGLWTRGAFLVLDVENDDSYGTTKQLLATFNVTEYPVLIVLDVQPQALNGKGRMVMKGRIVGFHTPAQLCLDLRKVEPRFLAGVGGSPSAACKRP